jgi:nitrogenase molybdenum-iron protein alpha/beta subunit
LARLEKPRRQRKETVLAYFKEYVEGKTVAIYAGELTAPEVLAAVTEVQRIKLAFMSGY